MPELINNGFIYIAQPPLFRAKRGKGETYIKDERELESYLIRRSAESRAVMLHGNGIFGPAAGASAAQAHDVSQVRPAG
jgi:DNA gyrase subunit B